MALFQKNPRLYDQNSLNYLHINRLHEWPSGLAIATPLPTITSVVCSNPTWDNISCDPLIVILTLSVLRV